MNNLTIRNYTTSTSTSYFGACVTSQCEKPSYYAASNAPNNDFTSLVRYVDGAVAIQRVASVSSPATPLWSTLPANITAATNFPHFENNTNTLL